jgi:DNA helicase-2/ATP-dependent DNA helicase PcrA
MTFDPTREQQRIIDHPLEPLRVTAGAGTGKTSTMALRLAAKIVSGELEPERALGITFTNKAAEELADRVRRDLGGHVDPGREVEVTTYHGFAFGLVREFGPFVGIPRSVRIVTPGYVRQLLRDAIVADDRQHLDLTKIGTVVDRLLSLSSSLGDHLLSPTDFAGSGTEDLAAERAEIATILTSFATRKRELGVVDFADLVTAAHTIVQQHPSVAERITSRYDLVLLDEYQDTNAGQRTLLLALFGFGFPITAVGDSDQTIYEWRGASPQNFEDFPKHFPTADGTSAPSLDLSMSWRSGRHIVDIANAVRAEITRPGPLPALRSRDAAEPGSIRTHWLHSSVEEAAWIADEVVRLHDEEGRAWNEIALLFRKHRQMGTIRDALVAAGVPVEVASLGGLLDVPEVADLHAWLRVLGRPDDAPALARILLGSRYRLGLADLVPLSQWVRAHRRADDEASIGWALLEAVDDLDGVEGLSTTARDRLARFRSEYRYLLGIAQGVSLVELCRQILDATGAWHEIDALPENARMSARLNTYRFLDLAEDWSPLEGGPSLEAFLDHLDVLTDEAAAQELDTASVSGENAVALLTVHRAKGLEWPVVVLPALAHNTFPSRVVRYEDPTTDATILPYEARIDRSALPELGDDPKANKEALKAAHDDAEWRTAYVAVTRAAEEIVATGAWWYTEGRPRTRSRLFGIIDDHAESTPGRSEDPGEPPETLRLRVERGPGPDPEFDHGATSFLARAIDDPALPHRTATERGIRDQYDAAVDQLRIQLAGLPEPPEPPPTDDRFRTSVTGLVTYAGCGLRYRFEHVDHLPRRPSAAARRGIDLHRRIELHHRGTVAFDEAAPGFYDAVSEDADERTESAYDRFAASRFADDRPIMVETPFELAVGDGAVSGRIDAVYEPDDDHWEIVDFKSGRHRDDPSLMVQLEAYAVAAAEAGLDGRAAPAQSTVTFAYFGGDGLVEVSEHVDDEWMENARHHLAELVTGAASGPYEASPGGRCRGCDFVRFCDTGRTWLKESSA